MRLLFFTLLLSMLSVSALFASEQEWNISSSDFNALGEISATTTINGLTIYATADAKVTVDANNKSINGMDFTNRLKLGGTGSIVADSQYRAISFTVPGNSTITVAAMSSSSSSDRELAYVDGTTGDTINIFPALGASITMKDYEYVGGPTTIYMFSKSSGINIYYIKVVSEDAVVTSNDACAIFDPATVDPSKLKDGMSVVEIDGKKYLQVIVNGWNSTIDVPEFTFVPGMTAFAEFKYVVGQTEYPASKINAAVQLIDTVNLMNVSWQTDPVSSTTGLIQSNPSGEFVKTSAGAASTMKVVHQVQFFGQQTSSWGAVVGDTLWVGKVRAYKVDDKAIFDPATYDPDDLVDGMSVVDLNGKKYLQVIVNGWNSTLNVPAFTLNDGVKAYAEFKYVVAQTQYPASKINAAVQLIDTVNLMTVSWSTTPVASTTGLIQSNPSGEFVKTSASIAATMKVAHQVQFFGQETASWGAVVGDTLWVGKVRAYTKDATTILDPAVYDPAELSSGIEIVKISNTQYFKFSLAGWGGYIMFDPFTTPAGTTGATMQAKYEVGTSGFELAKINTFLKFADADWNEIVASGSASSADFKDYTLSLAEGKSLGIFQVAGQETSGWSAVTGDYLYVGKISLVKQAETAAITFIVDDSNLKTSTGFGLKGSWKTSTGEYDATWTNGAEHAKFYDDGTHGDATAGDHKWTVTLNMVPDGGANSWEWGVNDVNGNWLYGNFKFTVADGTAQTLTHENTVSAKDFGMGTCKVYPNPATNMISIDNGEIKTVEIFNLVGVKVLSIEANSKTVNISSLKQGSYILKAQTSDGKNIVSRFNKN